MSKRSSRGARWVRIVLVVLGGAVMLSCPHNGKKQSQPEGYETGTVVLETGGKTVRVEVEVARTPEQRSRGLMYRKELASYRGMLFLFDREEVQSFWMKNTYIPLDMVFIDGKLKVVGVVENAEPLTTSSRRVEASSIYVLEVRGGFAAAHGIGPGTRVTLEGITP
jgi:uncharacterized membrane protein (UPF0127 family)